MLDITTVLAAVLVLLLLIFWLRKSSKLPPGPSLFDTLKLFDDSASIENIFLEWSRQYSDMMVFQFFANFGCPITIFVHNIDIVRKLFVKNADVFSNRPRDLWLINTLFRGKGIIHNPTNWRTTRRFATHSFGFGKISLNEIIENEARGFAEQIRSRNGQAFDPQEDISKAVANIICSITFGKRYNYTDPEFTHVLRNLTDIFKTRLGKVTLLNTFPWLRHFSFLFKTFSVKQIEKPFHVVKEFVYEEVMKQREKFDVNNTRTLVDLFIQAEKDGFKDKGMDEENVLQSVVDMFLAGVDNTAETFRWILVRLLNNPDVQKKCQDEIHKAIGTGRLPEYREKNVLPYTLAVIHETLRMDTVAMGSLPHTADKEIEIGEYVIPKGATVFSFTRGIMYDTKIWGDDAETFRPERWLNEEGQVRNVPEFIPFSIGRRICPGEQLAKAELFIFTVALLQKFTLQAEDPTNPPKLEGALGTTLAPKPFKLVAKQMGDNLVKSLNVLLD